MINLGFKYRFIVPISGLFLIFFTISCDKQTLFDSNLEISQPWNSSDKAKFEINITDTLNKYNVYLNIRNTTDYQYSNLYLFIKTVFPNNYIAIDTAEIFLADIKGNWLGKGFGDNKDLQILYRKGGRFVRKGIYHISIEQAMRDTELIGIKAVGIRIERSE